MIGYYRSFNYVLLFFEARIKQNSSPPIGAKKTIVSPANFFPRNSAISSYEGYCLISIIHCFELTKDGSNV